MELTNFGAVIKFALEAEERLKRQKNVKLLERVRRENINETVLQPISGLDTDNYAAADETALSRFYNDAADKLAIDEVKRIFKQLAKRRDL